MGNCKDCKYWARYELFEGVMWRECEYPTYGYLKDNVEDNDFALYVEVLDDSGLTLGMKTGPMFGCLKFTPKTTPTT